MVVKTNMNLHTRKKYIDDLIKSGIYKELIHKLYKEVNEDTLEELFKHDINALLIEKTKETISRVSEERFCEEYIEGGGDNLMSLLIMLE